MSGITDALADPPEAVVALARRRATARAARDFATADQLRVEIEAAGWRIVDRGTDFSLEPAHAPDVDDGARRRHGASASVPSRLAEPNQAPASVIMLATDWPADLDRTLAGLCVHAPASTQLIVVADDPSPEQTTALERLAATWPAMPDADASPPEPGSPAVPEPGSPAVPELVWTSARLGTAAAIDCGLRRSVGAVVILLDTSIEPTGDLVSPLVGSLADPTVAVAGGWGIVSDDLRTFREAPAGEVDAVEGYCLAFRRADFIARGPLDERFRFYRNLDIWWSLVLRDEGEGNPPRRALRIGPLPVVRHEHRGYASLPADERDRQSRRNFYRIIDRFGSRRDLLLASRAH